MVQHNCQIVGGCNMRGVCVNGHSMAIMSDHRSSHFSQEIRCQAVDLCSNIIDMELRNGITYSFYFKISYMKDLGTSNGLYVN